MLYILKMKIISTLIDFGITLIKNELRKMSLDF